MLFGRYLTDEMKVHSVTGTSLENGRELLPSTKRDSLQVTVECRFHFRPLGLAIALVTWATCLPVELWLQLLCVTLLAEFSVEEGATNHQLPQTERQVKQSRPQSASAPQQPPMPLDTPPRSFPPCSDWLTRVTASLKEINCWTLYSCTAGALYWLLCAANGEDPRITTEELRCFAAAEDLLTGSLSAWPRVGVRARVGRWLSVVSHPLFWSA